MTDVAHMSTAFLKEHELLAYSSRDALRAEFNTWLDEECEGVELPFSTQTFPLSHALRTLDPEAYEEVFAEYISEFIALNDGGYLHLNHVDAALSLAAAT